MGNFIWATCYYETEKPKKKLYNTAYITAFHTNYHEYTVNDSKLVDGKFVREIKELPYSVVGSMRDGHPIIIGWFLDQESADKCMDELAIKLVVGHSVD